MNKKNKLKRILTIAIISIVMVLLLYFIVQMVIGEQMASTGKENNNIVAFDGYIDTAKENLKSGVADWLRDKADNLENDDNATTPNPPQKIKNTKRRRTRAKKVAKKLPKGDKQDDLETYLKNYNYKKPAKKSPISATPKPQNKYYAAYIFQTQKGLTNNSSVKIITDEKMMIHGNIIPKNTLLIGKLTIAEQRLLINISNYEIQNKVFPCNIEAYSFQDNLRGLRASKYQNNNFENTIDQSITMGVNTAIANELGTTGQILNNLSGGIKDDTRTNNRRTFELINYTKIKLKNNEIP